MPIDAYSICPGGTGKKMKFCCPDFVGELEKINRMIEGDQFLAALQHIERLDEQGRQRACVMAIQAMLLRETHQFEAALAHVAEFLLRHPENPIAWAESAILTAAGEGGRAAIRRLQRAIALSDRQMNNIIYEAIGMVADVLIEDGDWIAGRALLHLQMLLVPDDTHPVELLMQLNRATDIPLLMKSEPVLSKCPDDAPWKARFDDAMVALQRARWQEMADRLTALAEEAPDAPAIWQNLAMVRLWLAEDDAAIDALRKLAALDVPLDDAVEAEALAMMLSKDPLGDGVDTLRLEWTVRDDQRLQELMLSDRRVAQVPFDPAQMATGDAPPPRMIFVLLDRPLPESSQDLSLDTMPQYYGQALLYGRQTDCEARLVVVGPTTQDAAQVKALLRELGGEAIETDAREEVARQTSGSQMLFALKWYPPRDTTQVQVDKLSDECARRALFEKWPQMPLGILGGKSPREASADPANRVRLLAAIMMLEHWTATVPAELDMNALRGQLGLPVPAPIDPEQSPIETVPLVRLSRVMVEKLSDEGLMLGFRRAVLFNARDALRNFGGAIVQRPSFADRPERMQAFSMLARTADSIDQALAHVEEGRRAALADGKSCASWDLLELTFRFGHAHANEAMALVQHIQQRHMKEQGVAERLMQILVDVGLLRPDGTPAVPAGRREVAAETAPPAADPNRIWTPGGEPSGGGGGGKIWTPG